MVREELRNRMPLKAQKERIFEWWKKNERGYLSFAISKYRLSEDQSRDILQEVAILVLRKLPPTIDSERQFNGWVKTTLKNRIIDWFRKQRNIIISFDESDIESTAHNQEETLFCIQILEKVEQLPKVQKTILLKHMMGMSNKEIAKEFNLKEATIRSNLRFARAHLSDLLS